MAYINKSVVFTEPNHVVIKTSEVGELKPDQILVQTKRSLISTGTECANLTGPPWMNPGGKMVPKYPNWAGYSNAGIVVDTGKDVKNWKPGDRIAGTASHATYPVYRGGDFVGKIPDEVSFEEAAFFTLSATVLNAVRIGQPQLGEDIVVVGLGILGQMALQFLSLAGARRLIAVDLSQKRLDIAARIGAPTHTLNPREVDVVEEVLRLTDGRGADVVYEITGLTSTYDLTFNLARRKGRVVGVGSPRWPAQVSMHLVHMKALRVLGAIVSSHPVEGNQDNRWTREANSEYFLELLQQGKINMKDLISHRFHYEDAPSVYAQLLEDRGKFMGVIFEWD